MTDKTATTQIYRIYIKARAAGDLGCHHQARMDGAVRLRRPRPLRAEEGRPVCHQASPEMKSVGLPDKMIVGEVIESDPPRKLVQTWHPMFNPDMIAEPHTRLT